MKRLLFFCILLLTLACNSSEKEKTNIPISNNSEKWLVLGDSAYRYGKNDSAYYYYIQYRNSICNPISKTICKIDICESLKHKNCDWIYQLAIKKYDEADYYAAKDLFFDILNCTSLDSNMVKLDLANTYAKIDKNKAIVFFKQASEGIAKVKLKAKIIGNFATFYSDDIKNYDSAIHYFQVIENYPEDSLPDFYWFNYGNACNQKARYISANSPLRKHYIQRAKEYTHKEYKIQIEKKDSFEMGTVCNNLGFYCMDYGKFDSAMYYFHHAYQYFYSFSKSNNTLPWLKMIRNYSGIAKTYYAKYAYTQDITELDSAMRYFLPTPKFMIQVRKKFNKEDSKSALTKLLYEVYEPALNVAYTYHKHKPSTQKLQYALNFIEAGKSLALLENIQDKMILKNAQIPDSLLNKENDLLKKITVIEEIDSSNVVEKKKLLSEQEELLVHFQKNYPNYYALKYSDKISSIENIQLKCKTDNSMFIDFFQGDTSIFVLYITPTTSGLIRKKVIDSVLNEQTATLRNTIGEMGNGDQKHKKQFRLISNQLYQSLFAELDSIFHSLSLSTPIKATLVLDGHLHKIPFDALLCDTLKKQYLIEKYNFSLAHSAAMYLQTASDKGKSSEVLAISPVFDATFNQFYPAPHRSENPLDSTFKTLTYLENEYVINPYFHEKANAKNFQKNAAHYGMIHLATHAVANDTIPEKSYIAFAPDSIGDAIHKGYFSLNEVYATPLNASLALLTACETGKGQIKKGEGVMSLARAFRYAGCERIIMTLWSVDEQSTMEITKTFYENLSKGESYGDALYKAKLQLKSKSPDKWAALVLIGDANGSFPLKKHNSWISIALLGLGGLILLGIGYFLYRKKRNL